MWKPVLRNTAQAAVLLIAALALSACTTMADRLQGRLEAPPAMGYAIFSLTGSAFEPDRTMLELRYQGISNSSLHGTVHASLLTDTVFGEQGMSPVEGKLELLTLPPGVYRFTEAYGYTPWDDILPMIGPRIVRLPINRDFTIERGETVYLGEIRLDLSYRPEVILTNSQQRDFGHIHRVWHVADTSHIVVRPLAGNNGERLPQQY
jgi:hypothetical protein